jgi:arylsulfatase A-like enzyme
MAWRYVFWFVAGCVLVAGRATAADQQAATRPNVLFIVSDDLNNLLGCYGTPQAHTPHIDRLAARGMRFERAYCTFPLCGPSRNSFLTGLYPNSTGILSNAQLFRQTIPSQLSMPQAFRLDGYFAARVGKLYHYNVPKSVGTDGHDDPASWEVECNPAGVDRLVEEPDITTLRPNQFGGTLSWYASPRGDGDHTDGMLAKDAEWILERCADRRDRPFFLAVGFFRPHTPYVAPEVPYFGLHPLDQMPVVTGVDKDREDIPAAALLSEKKEQAGMSEAQRREVRQAYAASISFMDAQVGRLLDTLDRLDLSDNTVIVFTSDHGYHMGEHGLWQKQSLFEESARVPMLIVAPGITKPGSVAPTPVSQVDLFPTLAELCGVVAPENLQGQSLVPVLHDSREKGRGWAITQVVRRRRVNGNPASFFGYSLRTPQYRYTEWDGGDAGRELYDHEADSRELTNLADSPAHAATVARLHAILQEAVATTLPPSGQTPELTPGWWNVNLTDP